MGRVSIKKKTFRKKTPKVSFEKRVTKIAQAVCAKDTETKMKIVNLAQADNILGAGLHDAGGAVGTPPGITIPNLLSSMNLQRGYNQESFLGNDITDAKLTIRGYIRTSPYGSLNPHTLPFEVHMVIYKRKKSSVNSNEQLKSFPSNQTGPVSFDIMNSLYPWNKDSYIIKKHRVFKMRPLNSDISVGADHNGVLNPQLSNAPMFRRFIQEIPISKKLIYPDTNTTPSNDWVGVSFYVISQGDDCTQGTGDNKAWDIRATLSMDAIMSFKDA